MFSHQLPFHFLFLSFIVAHRCPADRSRFEKKKKKTTNNKENQTNRASGEWHMVKICFHVSFVFSKALRLIHTYVDTQTGIETLLPGLLTRRTSEGFPEYLLFILTDTHAARTAALLPHSYLHKKPHLDLFWKAECTFKSSCELKLCPCFTLICRFPFVETLRPVYLNNIVAPLDCKTNTVLIFAGLSAFSYFIGIFTLCFILAEMNVNLAPESEIGI